LVGWSGFEAVELLELQLFNLIQAGVIDIGVLACIGDPISD